MGLSENLGPYFGVLIIGILQFRVLYSGPLFFETPMSLNQGRYLKLYLGTLIRIRSVP